MNYLTPISLDSSDSSSTSRQKWSRKPRVNGIRSPGHHKKQQHCFDSTNGQYFGLTSIHNQSAMRPTHRLLLSSNRTPAPRTFFIDPSVLRAPPTEAGWSQNALNRGLDRNHRSVRHRDHAGADNMRWLLEVYIRSKGHRVEWNTWQGYVPPSAIEWRRWGRPRGGRSRHVLGV